MGDTMENKYLPKDYKEKLEKLEKSKVNIPKMENFNKKLEVLKMGEISNEVETAMKKAEERKEITSKLESAKQLTRDLEVAKQENADMKKDLEVSQESLKKANESLEAAQKLEQARLVEQVVGKEATLAKARKDKTFDAEKRKLELAEKGNDFLEMRSEALQGLGIEKANEEEDKDKKSTPDVTANSGNEPEEDTEDTDKDKGKDDDVLAEGIDADEVDTDKEAASKNIKRFGLTKSLEIASKGGFKNSPNFDKEVL